MAETIAEQLEHLKRFTEYAEYEKWRNYVIAIEVHIKGLNDGVRLACELHEIDEEIRRALEAENTRLKVYMNQRDKMVQAMAKWSPCPSGAHTRDCYGTKDNCPACIECVIGHYTNPVEDDRC